MTKQLKSNRKAIVAGLVALGLAVTGLIGPASPAAHAVSGEVEACMAPITGLEATPTVAQLDTASACLLAASGTEYTNYSWKDFTTQVGFARLIYQSNPTDYYNRLTELIDTHLVRRGDTTALCAVLEATPHPFSEGSKYDNTTGNWSLYWNQRSLAQPLCDDNSEETQAMVDLYLKNLVEAFDRLVPLAPSTAVKALTDAIAAAEALNQADYTSASWVPLSAALITAKAVDTSTATVEVIQSATRALIDAIGTLVVKPNAATDFEVLTDLLVLADSLVEADYTGTSWASFSAALAAARAITSSASATDIQAATQNLQAAIDALVRVTPTPDPSDTGSVTPTPTNTGSPNPSPGSSTGAPKPNPSNSTGGNTTTSLTPTAPGNPFVGDPSTKAVVKVKAAQKAVTLVKGKKIKIPAYAYTSTGAKAKVTWSSNKSKVAKVNSKGTIRAKKVGKATITVKAANGLKAKIKVRVVSKARKGKPSKVTVKGVAKKLKVGQVAYATSSYKASTLTGIKVTYKSTAKAIVKVDKAGRVVAVKAGKATLRVKAGKKVKKIKITVS